MVGIILIREIVLKQTFLNQYCLSKDHRIGEKMKTRTSGIYQVNLKKSFLLQKWLIITLIIFPGTLLLAQLPDCGTIPDIIYYNGTIITLDPANPRAEAIAIKGDTILAVGSNDDIMAMNVLGCGSRYVDLNGLTILPGFIDSHTHWFSWREHICSVSEETTYPSMEEIMHMLAANGWTGISELNFGRPDFAPEHLVNALDLNSSGQLSVRLNGYWGTLDDVSLIDVLADSGRLPSTVYAERIHAPGVKMYVDDPFGTTDILTQEQVNQLVQSAHDNGWQVAAHAVNQSAVEKILTAFETVLGEESNESDRRRIEHAVKVSDDQISRMNQKGILASIQLLGPPDWPEQETFQTYVSNTDTSWVLRWKDLIGAESEGLHITGSTDAPFNDAPCEYSPFRIIYQAVTRIGYLDRAHADWELNQRLTIEQAIKLLTIDGAWATFEEKKKGSLVAGKWADLTIVSQNPLEVASAEDLLDITVLKTIVGGKVTFCKPLEDAGFCNPEEIFRVDSVSISSSQYLADQTPDKAYDNNPETNWGSGDDAPQWIQFDLGKEIVLGSLELVVDQWPAGVTTHQIWAKNDDQISTFQLLHEFNQNTEIGHVLTYTAPSVIPPYRHFKILTTQSPSWVSWQEIRFIPQISSSISENVRSLPASYLVKQNYPNPFNPSTIINYELPITNDVNLGIYNLLGQNVATLVNEHQQAGSHQVEWNAGHLSSGVYYYIMRAGEFQDVKKMILLR
jgi:predicted amidohydrolase YtcJ